MSQIELLLMDFMVALEPPEQTNLLSMGFEVGRPVPEFDQIFEVNFGANPGEPEEILFKRDGVLEPMPVMIRHYSGVLVDASGEVGTVIPFPPPRNLAVPNMSGLGQTGEILSCSTGVWEFTPATYTYQWLRSGVGITGATSDNYTLVVEDEGTIIACRVTATNIAGSSSANSNAVKPIAPGLVVDPLDGQVTNVTEFLAIVNNPANAGNSYWMRGGFYGEMNLTTSARPATPITFTTYPGEQVLFGKISIMGAARIHMDGSADNMVRAPAALNRGDHPDGFYGLWFRGSGITGDFLPPVPNIITIEGDPSNWAEGLEFRHCRFGDSVSADVANWRKQHGVVFASHTRDIVIEDFFISYIASDQWHDVTEGDFQAGGYGMWWVSPPGPYYGNYTFRRGHWCHCFNDFIQYGPKEPDPDVSLVLFEQCLFEEIYNYGAAHADFFQAFGGSSTALFDGCVFRNGSDFLLHGNNPGGMRTFRNTLFYNFHRITQSKDDEHPSDYTYDTCTLDPNLAIGGEGISVDSLLGAAATSNMVLKNCVYNGTRSSTFVNPDAVFTSEGEPNIFWDNGLFNIQPLSTDIAGTPIFNGQHECTNFSQGWRVPVGFPWSLGSIDGPPVNTDPPIVTGTPQLGQGLSCSSGTWANTPASYNYEWQRDTGSGFVTTGIFSAFYTVQVADYEADLRCVVTAANAIGSMNANSNELGPVIDLLPNNVEAPAITGTATTGNVLTCDTGTWGSIDTPTFAYQWQRDGVNISGATANIRTLVTADETHSIRCRVTATNPTGSAFVYSNSVTATLSLSAPVNTVAPVISTDGTPVTGETVSCSTGTWTGNPTPTYAYQWKRGGTNISGATSSSYLLAVADVGTSITCTVTATNSQGSANATSATITPTAPSVAPTNTVAPVITTDGSPVTGETVTCSTGTWTGTATITYAYQWRRDGTNISGQTASTHVLVTADETHAITCRVTATNSQGSANATSASITPSAPGGGPPALDGQVTTAAQIVAIVNNAANAGKSYWMRGGNYGEMNLDEDARPSSLITFITYPGEQVRFQDVGFFRSKNMRFDGNVDNMIREPASTGGDLMEGDYGLWFRGSGITGNDIPDVNNALTFHGSGGGADQWNENLQFAHFRVGDDMAAGDFPDDTPWRRQHGIVIANFSKDLLFEDFEIAYVGCDLNGEGDFSAGGFGIWFASSGSDGPEWGDYTFRRGHVHHTNNDFVQYDAKNSADGICLFEHCLFEELHNYGLAHADFFQCLGGSTQLLMDGCVFQHGTDFLLHGNNPGATRLFNNCLIGNPNDVYNAHQIVLGKDEELGEPGLGAESYEWRNCTIILEVNGINVNSTLGSSFTSDFVIANSIYTGVRTETGVVFANVFTTDSQPNRFVTGSDATMLSGDSTGTPVYNSQGECTNFSQGWRKPSGFPWTL